MRKRVIYHFSSPTYGWTPQLTIIGSDGRGESHTLFDATYARFVEVANSGNYDVRIADQEGVAWEMERKVIAPRTPERTPCEQSQFKKSAGEGVAA